MSNSTKSRIQRKNPNLIFSRTTYRSAWPHLMSDFGERCAYSMQHISKAGGSKSMEVDHFNPRRKKDEVQEYLNLFLASRHCNGAKGNHWPSNKERKRGIRFLNCCEEADYDIQILEDPDTHKVVGMTPAARFHIRYCDLNDPWLIEERKDRNTLWNFIENKAIFFKGSWALPEAYFLLKEQAEKMIPRIKFLSGSALESQRAKRAALAALKQ